MLKGKLFDKFLEVMGNDTERESFRQFVITTNCEENFDFYIQASAYETIPNEEDRKQTGTKIYNTFIRPYCSRPVNISGEVRSKLQRGYQEKKFEDNLFRDCKNEICHLLVMDSLSRFLVSH